MQCKKEKKECWFYDEKWARGRKCNHNQLLMLDVVLNKEDGGKIEEELQVRMHQMTISECAF